MGGLHDAEEICSWSSEDMANEAKKKENDAFKKYYQELATARSNADVATTDNFKCHKCGQRKCTYFQLQTRYIGEQRRGWNRDPGCGVFLTVDRVLVMQFSLLTSILT